MPKANNWIGFCVIQCTVRGTLDLTNVQNASSSEKSYCVNFIIYNARYTSPLPSLYFGRFLLIMLRTAISSFSGNE
jgi:hypothetical protein